MRLTMFISDFSGHCGRIWAHISGRRWNSYLRKRAKDFNIHVIGSEFLEKLHGSSYLIISNHNCMKRSELWPTGYIRYLWAYNHSPDSFVIYQAIREITSKSINTVALGFKHNDQIKGVRAWIGSNIFRSFWIGNFRNIPGLICVEQEKGRSQRAFLKDIDHTVKNNEPILIFPTGNIWEEGLTENEIHPGFIHIAKKHKLPVVVSCITGTQTWKQGSKVRVVFTDPIIIDYMSKDEVINLALVRIEALLDQYDPERNGEKFN